MIDPRANSKESLQPKKPLPHISRRALARVKNPLPPPTECPYCHGEVQLVNNSQIYGKSFGEWPYSYSCNSRGCDARVGLHPHTDLPLGIMADKHLREARPQNKYFFMQMMRKFDMNRTRAYEWLAKKMKIEKERCHWAWFDEDQCDTAGEICMKAINTGDLTL